MTDKPKALCYVALQEQVAARAMGEHVPRTWIRVCGQEALVITHHRSIAVQKGMEISNRRWREGVRGYDRRLRHREDEIGIRLQKQQSVHARILGSDEGTRL